MWRWNLKRMLLKISGCIFLFCTNVLRIFWGRKIVLVNIPNLLSKILQSVFQGIDVPRKWKLHEIDNRCASLRLEYRNSGNRDCSLIYLNRSLSHFSRVITRLITSWAGLGHTRIISDTWWRFEESGKLRGPGTSSLLPFTQQTCSLLHSRRLQPVIRRTSQRSSC